MLNGRLLAAIGVIAVLICAAPALAGNGGFACPQGGGCGFTSYAPQCAPACPQACPQTRTVMVPRTFTETQQITCTEFVPEQRTRTFTVNRMVTETNPVQREFTEMVAQTRTRTENFTVSVPFWRQEERQHTVMVPQQETRQATRAVCQWVPETVMQTVCRDNGHWEDRPIATQASCDPCPTAFTWSVSYGGYGSGFAGCPTACPQTACPTSCAPATTRVWVPNIVHEQVPTTVMRQQIVNQPYEYTCTVMRPEQRSYTVNVCDHRQEQRSREVNFVEYVPTKRTFTENVTTCRWVPEERSEQYTVMVPRQVQRDIQVQVCRMVPEEITVQTACYPTFHTASICNTCF
jgi:hypothetical protein